MLLLFKDRVSNQIADRVIVRSEQLPIEPHWFMFLGDLESSLDPYRKNKYGCLSWIQFCANKGQENWAFENKYKTIQGRQYKLSDLEKWTPLQLLDLSFDYLEEQQSIHGRFYSYHDLYFSILFPIAIGKPDDYVLNTQSNPIFDINNNGSITVGEVKKYLDNRVKAKVPSAYLDIFFKKKVYSSCTREKLYYGEELRLAS